MHDIYDMIYKFGVVVFDQTGVFPGYDDLVSRFFFYFGNDPECQIVRNHPAGNHPALVDAERAVFRYVGNLVPDF